MLACTPATARPANIAPAAPSASDDVRSNTHAAAKAPASSIPSTEMLRVPERSATHSPTAAKSSNAASATAVSVRRGVGQQIAGRREHAAHDGTAAASRALRRWRRYSTAGGINNGQDQQGLHDVGDAPLDAGRREESRTGAQGGEHERHDHRHQGPLASDEGDQQTRPADLDGEPGAEAVVPEVTARQHGDRSETGEATGDRHGGHPVAGLRHSRSAGGPGIPSDHPQPETPHGAGQHERQTRGDGDHREGRNREVVAEEGHPRDPSRGVDLSRLLDLLTRLDRLGGAATRS